MAFKLLSQDKQDDSIVAFYLAQEADLHSHQVNKARFEAMLAGELAADFREKLNTLLRDTNSRIAEVSAIIAATESQLPPQGRCEAAVKRLQANGAV